MARRLGAQRVNHVAEAAETFVDGLRLAQPVACRAGLGQSLRTGQVDQVQHACALFLRRRIVAAQSQGEDAMAAR